MEVVVFFILGDRLSDEEDWDFGNDFNALGESTCSAIEKSSTKSPIPTSDIAPSGDEVGARAATCLE